MTKKCLFNKCDGSGTIVTVKDGVVYASICECVEEEQKKLKQEKMLKFADIPPEFIGIKVNNFKNEIYTSIEALDLAAAAKRMTVNYVMNFEKFKEEGKGLYYYSKEKGSGKTMLAIALGNALINMHSVMVKFLTTPDLLSEIKKTYDRGSEYKESELLESLKQVEVLILDDIGIEKQSGWMNEILYKILNHRMTSKLITIFTSNVHITQLEHDERIKSRIEKMALPVQMPEESIRKQLAQRENDEMVKLLLR